MQQCDPQHATTGLKLTSTYACTSGYALMHKAACLTPLGSSGCAMSHVTTVHAKAAFRCGVRA